MRYLLTFALLLALSFAVSDDTSAEPVVFMVAVSPSTIDNQVEEEVNFEGVRFSYLERWQKRRRRIRQRYRINSLAILRGRYFSLSV